MRKGEWRRDGSPNLFCFVLFCFWCLHMLPELVNHIGSLSYHNILTKWWYLLKFSLQPKPLGCALQTVFCCLFFFLKWKGDKDKQGIVCQTVHSNFKRMYFFSAFNGLKHFSSIQMLEIPTPFVLAFHFISIFHMFCNYFLLCSHQHSLPLNLPKETIDMFLLLFL